MNVFVRQLSRLNWITTVIIPMAVVFMEVYWLYPWFLWLGKLDILAVPGAPLSIGGVIVLLGGGFAVTRYLLSREWSLSWIRWGIIICGLLVVFTVIRSEYHAGYALLDMQWFVHTVRILLDFSQFHPLMIALPAGAYLWWRGISRGRAPLYAPDIYRTFIAGTISFVLLVIVWSITLGAGSLEDLASTVAPHVAAFFFFALVSMALINLQSIRQKMTPEDVGPSFNRRWLPILVLVVGSIVLVGIGIASIFSPEFVAFLSRLVGSIGDVVREVLRYILFPLGYIATALYWVGLFIVNLIRGEGIPEFEGPSLDIEEEATEVTQGAPVSEVVILVLKWVLFAIITISIIYLLSKAVRRFRVSRMKTDVTEVNESLWNWDDFLADIRLFLSSIWQHLWHRKKEVVANEAAPHRYLDDEEEGTMSIREIYRRLLWQAARFGMGRRGYETPYEYRVRLEQLVPDCQEPLTEITDLYVSVRYGEIDTRGRQVNRANTLWQGLKKILRPSLPGRTTSQE
jgi:hypothetical protein